VSGIPAEIDDATLRGLERDPTRRFARARDMAMVLENSVEMARASAVGEWVTMLGEEQLRERAELVGDIEAHKKRVVTSVLSQSFERPDGFPTVVEAGSGQGRTQKRNKRFVFAAGAALAVAALSVAATRRGSWRNALASAISEAPSAPRVEPAPAPPDPRLVVTAVPIASVAPPAEPTPARPPIAETPPPRPTTTADKKTSGATSSPGSKQSRAVGGVTPPRKTAKCQPYITDAEGVRVYNTECLKQQSQ
jgi:hypothetical protein